MKKLTVILLGFIFIATTNAQPSVSVDFKNPEKYRDIDPGTTQSTKTFRKRLFSTLEKSFNENMEQFSTKYNLKVTVLDVDLAGKVNRGLANEIRTINDHDFPRLHFYIVLENKDGEIVLQGEQNLKERKDKHKSFRMKGSQSEFYLETSLIDQWFDKALLPAIGK